ncbi:MAG TPA: TonB family protein [Pyrinomonadaceae bacterium]|nr:TonB family protein [Pyrinomonadaceae bacterium]
MKILILVVCVCLFDLGVAQTIHAQKRIANPSATATNSIGNRQQDGLNGQVRRIRVETVSLLVKEGKTVEGPPVIREITTYDPRGQKIDSIAYPADESTVVGNKQQYVYDDKGNIIEMVMRGEDGSVLNRVRYDYEFDEFGNWKKMTGSIAVYENGHVGYEPFEITKRTITYYYGQPPPKATTASVPPGPKTNAIASAAGPAEIAKPASDVPLNVAATRTSTSDTHTNTAADPLVTPPDKRESSIAAPATVTPKDDKLPTIRMSEEALRKAAIDLPQPQYPEAARLLGAAGTVEVQVLIDEKGEVTKASALSGDALFTEVAAEAARKAKFSRAKLSPDPAKIYGVIKYTFSLPDAQPAASPATNAASTKLDSSQLNQGISDLKILQPGDHVETDPEPAVDSLSPAALSYGKGLELLAAGRPSEAVEALKQVTNLDPNNAAAYAKLGIAYAAAQQPQDAIAALKIAIRIKPELLDAEAYFQLSNAYSELGKFSDALKAIKQATYIKRAEQANPETAGFVGGPSLADLHYSAGLTYSRMRRYYEAIAELKQVIALNPKLAQAYYGLALSYIAVGDLKAARNQQETLESLDPVYAAKITKSLSAAGANNIRQGFGSVYKNVP